MAYEQLKVSPDSILTLANEILAANPTDFNGIRFSEHAERAKGNVSRANDLLVELLALEPQDVSLQEEVIRAYAEQKDFTRALEIVARAKASSPGQPETTSLEALICFAISDWPCAIRAHEELAVVDTSAVTAPYFERLIRAYRESGNVQEAANAAGRAATKFADSVGINIVHAQMLRENGDTAGSIVAAKKALALDPTRIDTYIQIAAAYGPSQIDSLLSTLEAAVPHITTQADTARIFNMAFAPGQQLFNEAQEVADSLRTDVEWTKFQNSLRFVEFSHKLMQTDHTKFYQAATHYFIGFKELAEAHKLQGTDGPRTCELSKSAYERWSKTRDFINDGGGRAAPPVAGQMLGAIDGNQQTLVELRAAFCKN
jgi:tetratricopeptide (TPR) repeat protein